MLLFRRYVKDRRKAPPFRAGRRSTAEHLPVAARALEDAVVVAVMPAVGVLDRRRYFAYKLLRSVPLRH
jgi:hypothetical protein